MQPRLADELSVCIEFFNWAIHLNSHDLNQIMHTQSHLQGIVYMVVGIFLLSVMDAVAKWLVTETLDPLQLIAVRSWIVVTLLMLYYRLNNKSQLIKPNRPVVQGIRGLFGFLAPYCFFKSMQTLPLADATVIFFSGIFMITALSWPLLKEKVGVHRWVAVIVGFIGVIIAMNPKGGGQTIGYIYCLIGSLTYALLFISGRWLSKTESVISLVFCFNLGLAAICTLLVPLVWVPMSLNLLVIVFMFSLLALSGHICLTTAFSRAPVGVVAPFEYTGLVWTVILGYMIWSDIPASNVVLGAFIIVICGLYVIYRESKAKPSNPI